MESEKKYPHERAIFLNFGHERCEVTKTSPILAVKIALPHAD
jgi:hypothetical protein